MVEITGISIFRNIGGKNNFTVKGYNRAKVKRETKKRIEEELEYGR